MEVLFLPKVFWGVKILVGLSHLSLSHLSYLNLSTLNVYGAGYVSSHTVCLINCEILHSHN